MKSGHLIYGRADFEAPAQTAPHCLPRKNGPLSCTIKQDWVSRLEYRKTVTRYQIYGTVLHQRR